MKDREMITLQLRDCDKTLRSVDERSGVNCVGKPDPASEPIPDVDAAAYFKKLRAVGVEQFNALKITIGSLEQVHDESLPVNQRRSIAEAMRAAVEVLPHRLVPIGQTQEIYSVRRR